jgi:predicted DsbA family dithiol-disulfide isomerase
LCFTETIAGTGSNLSVVYDSSVPSPVRIDIWSDIVCPWCYIGKRRLEAAISLAQESHPDLEVEVEYHAFQLDPRAPVGQDQLVRDVYEKKFGGAEQAQQLIDHVTAEAAGEGLEFRLDIAKRSNTILGHRVLRYALEHGRQLELKERLLSAYFTEGAAIGQLETLLGLAADVDLDPEDLRIWLGNGGGEAEVSADLQLAADNDITAVPTFVFNRAYAVPGALDATALARVLTRLRTAEV